MTETIKTLLQPIQNRLNAATPGPWANYGDLGHEVFSVNADEDGGPENITLGSPQLADAYFIAAAPTDQARLLAAVQAVLEVADRWEEDFPHKAWQIRSALSKALTEAR